MDKKYAPEAIVPGTVYRVVREIGAGGMGRVYEVEDTTIGKRYALKVLRDAHASSPDQVERMRLESRTMVRVAHPNIVDVITAGVTADGSFYYVMAMLQGRSLRRVLKDAVRLPAIAAVRVAVDIGDALVQAHAEGVVHRDVKPDNIFVATRQMTTSAKLLDFGVAAMLDNLRTTLRETGKLLGTPRYASPQQQRGEKAHPSMDIWALGYVLFEALVGHGPFRGRTMNEIIVSVQGPEPAFRLSDFLQDASPALDDILASMLEKEVAKRAPSMADVTHSLQVLLGQLEENEVPPGTEDTTLETMIGLLNRSSTGDARVKATGEKESSGGRGVRSLGTKAADTATPPFFADPPGTASRASIDLGRAKVLPDLNAILPAGELAEGELDPEALDRAWGLLSTDVTAPVWTEGNPTAAVTIISPAVLPLVGNGGETAPHLWSGRPPLAPAAVIPRARPAAGTPPKRESQTPPREIVVSTTVRPEDSDSPSVQSSSGASSARRAHQDWLVPAVTFGVTVVAGIAVVLFVARTSGDASHARDAPTAGPVAASPTEEPNVVLTPTTSGLVVPRGTEPRADASFASADGASPSIASARSTTGTDGSASAAPIAPTRTVRPRSIHADSPPRTAASTTPAEDDFKFDTLLNP